METRYQKFETKQIGPHPSLPKIVAKHRATVYKRPIPQHQKTAFSKFLAYFKSNEAPLIIDSCCGTGMSTHILAQRFPDHLVVGIDKSSARLARALPSTSPNCLLIHGDVIDLWRLIKGEELPIRRHYLLFPNPWPKADQVKRRFHAHPVFETMVSLAPYFELRTNWLLYAKEMMNALTLLGQKPTLRRKADDDFMTLFEKKYQENSCPVYMVQNRLMAFPEQEQLSRLIPNYR